jgi:3-hydroxybutyryl-CoA dehydrogenase
MQIVVLTNESLKDELLAGVSSSMEEVIWVETVSQLQQHKNADVFVDLLFENDHTADLQNLLPGLVVINSVEETLSETNPSFVRINGWPSFLKSALIEASSLNENNKKKAEHLFYLFNKKLEWLPDEVGFVTPRVISMIVNEAFIALKEGVSTKEEIDIAMKLGTNYPYGPFEWAEKIGTERIKNLLSKLSVEKK